MHFPFTIWQFVVILNLIHAVIYVKNIPLSGGTGVPSFAFWPSGLPSGPTGVSTLPSGPFFGLPSGPFGTSPSPGVDPPGSKHFQTLYY